MALFPTGAIVLLVGLVVVRLSWTWGQDDYAAGIVADRLLRAEPTPDGPLEVPTAPNPAWWSSTPEHLHLRALALSRSESDPVRSDQIHFLLSTAKNAAPLDPAVRLALAEVETSPAGPALGLSRDFVALRKTGQGLLAAGKTHAALRVDREALDIAARIELARAPLPSFVEDSQVRRFRLPNEEAMSGIVQDLAGHRGWHFADWAAALPPNGLAALVAYRILREAGDVDADAALGLVLEAKPDPSDPTRSALVLAAQAEALALAERWDEAAARYREAIELMPSDLIRRTWWLNLGEIAGRQGDLDLMRRACSAARGPSPKDEINARMITARARYGLDGAVKKTAAKDEPSKTPPPR
jgi:tetratricopeptide (TPR) repeat protein